MTEAQDRALRDLSLMAQDAREDKKPQTQEVVHSAINDLLDAKKKEKK